MGLSFLDVFETVAPIGLAMIPGIGIPAAIAASAALKGGTTAAKGGDWGDILLNTGLGAASGAAGAGISSALSKGLSSAATKTTEKAMDVGLKEILGAGLDEAGMPIVTGAAVKGSADAFAKAAPKVARLEKLAKITSGGREGGEFDDKTKQTLGTLKTVGKTASALGDVKDMAMPEQQPPRFLQVQGQMVNPNMGMDPRFQFGPQQRRYGTAVVGGGLY